MSQSQTASHYALRADVAVTAVDSGAVMLDLQTNYFYSLNASGWALAQLFEDGADTARAQAFAASCGAGEQDQQGVADFVNTMIAEGLVEPASPAGEPETPDFTSAAWQPPAIEKHREPLQRIMTSAFDPSIPLAE